MTKDLKIYMKIEFYGVNFKLKQSFILKSLTSDMNLSGIRKTKKHFREWSHEMQQNRTFNDYQRQSCVSKNGEDLDVVDRSS